MKHAKGLHERRALTRPEIGDRKPCPLCGEGDAEFIDRYRAPLPATRGMVRMPAWVCEACRYARPVRAEHQPEAVRAAARRLLVKGKRLLMKSASVRQRADRALDKSLTKKRHSR